MSERSIYDGLTKEQRRLVQLSLLMAILKSKEGKLRHSVRITQFALAYVKKHSEFWGNV